MTLRQFLGELKSGVILFETGLVGCVVDLQKSDPFDVTDFSFKGDRIKTEH